MQAESLLRFLRIIEIDETDIKRAESLRDYHLSIDVIVEKLKRVSIDDLNMIVGEFGTSLTLIIGDAPPLLEIKEGKASSDLSEALGHISQYNNTLPVCLDLVINKSIILDNLGLNKDTYNSLFYIFSENFSRFLRSSLVDLDEKLFTKKCKQAIIIISDFSVHYEGPLLTIVGVNDYQLIKNDINSIDKKWLEWMNKYYKSSFDNLSWIGFSFKKVTPIHFFCKRLSGTKNPIDLILANHMLNLCILYTANRTSYDNKSFHASFAGPARIITLDFTAQSSDLELASQSLIADDQKLLLRFALWPYSDKGTDRLVIFQNVIAREFENGDLKNYYAAFVKLLPNMLNDAIWHHRIYIDGQIDKNFEQVQAFTNYITDITNQVSKTLDETTKGLTETLLASVGVIILTLLASLAEKNMQDIIFRNSMQIYAIYLLVFQGLYRMGSILHSYHLLKMETDERLASYALILGDRKVSIISLSLTKRRKQFMVWFIATVIIYICVSVMIWILGNTLPQYIAQAAANNSTQLDAMQAKFL